MAVALVTDTTAYLPGDLVRGSGIAVVSLQVAADGVSYLESDLDPSELLRLLRRSRSVTTSRPSPRALHEVYERLADDGVDEVVSVHLSGVLSGTCDAARLAAGAASLPVHVVDSRTMGMTLGHAVLTGACLAAAGADGATVADAVERRARAGALYFYVHTLEYLRRGGRIGRAASLLGSALAMRPLLRVVDGGIEPVEKARTTGKALARLVELVADEVERDGRRSALTVHHLDEEERAQRLAGALVDRLGDALVGGDVEVLPIGAVAATHLGPGAMAVSSSPEL